MALCALCLDIPADELPEFPTTYYTPRGNWKFILPYRVEYGAPKPQGPLGFPHQPDLHALRKSAEACGLCRLMLGQVDLVVNEFRSAQKERIFPRDHRDGYPLYRLYLARRQNTGKGFLILSPGTDQDVVYLLGAIGLAAREGDALSTIFTGRIVDDDVGNQTTLDRTSHWERECREHHPKCTALPSWNPTRLVDLGEDAEGRVVHIIQAKTMDAKKYVALSHCWGKYRLPLKVTKAGLEKSNAISLDDFSKSSQDAVAVTRSLGFQYIWIDSLCILQDDRNDWLQEFAQMHSVYSNASLTISITGAEDGRIGCFAGRTLKEYVPLPYTDNGDLSGEIFAFPVPMDKESRPEKYIEMNAEPVSERAWCFQERVLSRRVLHFASDQMYFECNAGFRSEDGLYLRTRYFTLHGPLESCFLPGPRRMDLDSTITLWHSILWAYGPRKLTDGSDKLPAFAGVAAVFAQNLNDQYVAGIWRKSMVEGLLWRGLDVTEVEFREPSWSWLSINGIPASGLSGRWEPLACILDCHVDLVGESPFGEVKSGWIRMEAPLLPLTLVETYRSPDEAETDLPLRPKGLTFRTAGGPGRAGSRGTFDFIGERHVDAERRARDGRVFALVLAVTVGDPAQRILVYQSLLVTPVNGRDGKTFRRVGLVNQEIETLGFEETRTSRTIVTLV